MIELYELAGQDPDLRFSPYCWRVRMALAHKGEEAVTIPWRFHEKTQLPGAPHNEKVPVLVDDGEIVSESTAIAFHLEEAYDTGPSLFGGPAGEAHARFILSWTDSVLVPALAPFLVPKILPLLHPKDRAYFKSSREARFNASMTVLADGRSERLPAIRSILTPLRVTLSHQAFLGGDEPSYADYAVFGCFQWARCVGADNVLDPQDTLNLWHDSMLDLFDGLARSATIASD
jgi:glutathione S-transferase